MAPEVIEEKAYDLRADLYSLGVVFYFILHGSYPYNPKNKAQLLVMQREEKIDFSKVNLS